MDKTIKDASIIDLSLSESNMHAMQVVSGMKKRHGLFLLSYCWIACSELLQKICDFLIFFFKFVLYQLKLQSVLKIFLLETKKKKIEMYLFI